MFLAQPNSGPPCIPEFDVAVVGRSFASLRTAERLRRELRLQVVEAPDATTVRYDDVNHRWEIDTADGVAARAKFVLETTERIRIEGRRGLPLDHTDTGFVVRGFPNLLRLGNSGSVDPVGSVCRLVEHMRSNVLDYVEARSGDAATDSVDSMTFDRPVDRVHLRQRGSYDLSDRTRRAPGRATGSPHGDRRPFLR